MPLVYTISQVAKLTEVSASSIRNIVSGPYGELYKGSFSPGAAPGKGQPRQFTPADAKLLAYIREQTARGVAHAEIAAQVNAGALDGFAWSPPAVKMESEPAPSSAEPQAPEPSAALVVVQEVARQLAGVIMGQLTEAQAENARAQEENRRLQDALAEARERAARAEGELVALKGRSWWSRLWGK